MSYIIYGILKLYFTYRNVKMSVETVQTIYKYSTPKIRKLLFLMVRNGLVKIQNAIMDAPNDDDEILVLCENVTTDQGVFPLTREIDFNSVRPPGSNLTLSS